MYNTVLIGLGRIASKYNLDKVMQTNLKYFTHSQVLYKHEEYNWTAAVDPSPSAREYAKKTWKIKEVESSIKAIKNREKYEIAVIATPPDKRLETIEYFPSLKGVIVEKPLGESYKSSLKFIEECEKRGIAVQVNLTRRSDRIIKELSAGDLEKKIGKIQFVFGSYGRGLHNYGMHLIDLVRMLVGEISFVKSLSSHNKKEEGPIKGDLNLSFVLRTVDNIQVIMQPLDFSYFREGSIDIWGERGRIEIVQEGLKYIETSIEDCRSLSGALELAADKRKFFDTGYSEALYNLYSNLAESIAKSSKLDSSGRSALRTEMIVDSLFRSAKQGGSEISC